MEIKKLYDKYIQDLVECHNGYTLEHFTKIIEAFPGLEINENDIDFEDMIWDERSLEYELMNIFGSGYDFYINDVDIDAKEVSISDWSDSLENLEKFKSKLEVNGWTIYDYDDLVEETKECIAENAAWEMRDKIMTKIRNLSDEQLFKLAENL